MRQRHKDLNFDYFSCETPSRQNNSSPTMGSQTNQEANDRNAQSDVSNARHLLNLFSMVTELQREVIELRRENRALAAGVSNNFQSLRQDNHGLANLIVKSQTELRSLVDAIKANPAQKLSPELTPEMTPEETFTERYQQPMPKPINKSQKNIYPASANRELIALGVTKTSSSKYPPRSLRSSREKEPESIAISSINGANDDNPISDNLSQRYNIQEVSLKRPNDEQTQKCDSNKRTQRKK